MSTVSKTNLFFRLLFVLFVCTAAFGQTAKEGCLPTGVCLTGRVDADAVLLAAGQAFQAATQWHVAVPPI